MPRHRAWQCLSHLRRQRGADAVSTANPNQHIVELAPLVKTRTVVHFITEASMTEIRDVDLAWEAITILLDFSGRALGVIEQMGGKNRRSGA
jgi:hypothetical protein